MMARMLSLFLLIIFGGQSWGLVVAASSDSYRYDESGITENTQIRDHDLFKQLLGAEVRQPLESLTCCSVPNCRRNFSRIIHHMIG